MKKLKKYLKKYFSNEGSREELIPLSIILGLVILIILGCVLSISFDFRKTRTMHYEEKSDLDYKVYLKENEFYDTPYLPKDKKYISALINYIDASFAYSFKSEENIDLKYSYYIDAKLKIDYVSGENIYEKTYIPDNISAYFSAWFCGGLFAWIDQWITRGMSETPDEMVSLLESIDKQSHEK